jgi:hypothetical protein
MEFEKEAQKLLQGGGIKNKSVKIIQDISKVIREKIDSNLEKLNNNRKIDINLFITSDILREIWQKEIIRHCPTDQEFVFKIG